MVDRINKAFGDNRSAAFRELFTQNIGGQRTVSEEYRLEGHHRYRAAATMRQRVVGRGEGDACERLSESCAVIPTLLLFCVVGLVWRFNPSLHDHVSLGLTLFAFVLVCCPPEWDPAVLWWERKLRNKGKGQ